MIPQVTIEVALSIFKWYHIDALVWMTCSVQAGKYDGMICDYSSLAAYDVKYACEVWDVKKQCQVERFNVMK